MGNGEKCEGLENQWIQRGKCGAARGLCLEDQIRLEQRTADKSLPPTRGFDPSDPSTWPVLKRTCRWSREETE